MKTLADLSAPADIQRKSLEKDIQSQCVDWARKRGYWARKFSSMTQRSVPDYLFAGILTEQKVIGAKIPNGVVRIKFWVEFKKPGNTSTPAQLDEQAVMTANGWIGFECDNFEKFKFEVERIEKVCCTTEA